MIEEARWLNGFLVVAGLMSFFFKVRTPLDFLTDRIPFHVS